MVWPGTGADMDWMEYVSSWAGRVEVSGGAGDAVESGAGAVEGGVVVAGRGEEGREEEG